MSTLSSLSRALIAIAAGWQIFFVVLEMIFWTSDRAVRVSGFTNVRPLGGSIQDTMAGKTQSLGRNMGLYNGFLAAGLIWSLRAAPPLDVQLALFFSYCMLIAGIYGGLTINPKHHFGVKINPAILIAQGGFALAALLALLFT